MNTLIDKRPTMYIALNRYAVGSRPADRAVARPRDYETRLLSKAFPMSALPRIATTERTCQHVSNVPILLQKSACSRRGTAGAIFLKPSVATRWIERAAYARLY